jgi:hypothetical protein
MKLIERLVRNDRLTNVPILSQVLSPTFSDGNWARDLGLNYSQMCSKNTAGGWKDGPGKRRSARFGNASGRPSWKALSRMPVIQRSQRYSGPAHWQDLRSRRRQARPRSEAASYPCFLQRKSGLIQRLFHRLQIPALWIARDVRICVLLMAIDTHRV